MAKVAEDWTMQKRFKQIAFDTDGNASSIDFNKINWLR